MNHNLRVLVLGSAVALLASPSWSQDAKSETGLRDLIRVYTKTADPAAGAKIASKLGVAKVEGVVALEYKVLLEEGNTWKVVNPETHEFKLEDRIRIRVEPFNKMYVYLFHEAASGSRTCLVPATDEPPPMAEGNKEMILPSDGALKFSTPPGDEKLVVVASEEAIPDLVSLANVVFKKEVLTPKEQELKDKLTDGGKKAFKNLKDRDQRLAYRGILNDEALKRVGGSKTGITLEEPPHGAVDSSLVAATAVEGKRPQLLVNITLKSAEKKKQASK